MNRTLFNGLLLTIGGGFSTVASALHGMGSEVGPFLTALPISIAVGVCILDRLDADTDAPDLEPDPEVSDA